MRSMVEGACGAEAGREAEAPTTALRAVPLPRFAGQDGSTIMFLRLPRSGARQSYCAGPSWQDCGAGGESCRHVGTSHFEQAASARPQAATTSSRQLRHALPYAIVRNSPKVRSPTSRPKRLSLTLA